MNRIVPYEKVRGAIATGDLIAYNGRGPLSTLIRWVCGYPTHVAMVSRVLDTNGDDRVQTIESTSMKVSGERIIGVQRTYLSERLANYDGDIWWLPLCTLRACRILRNKERFQDLLDAREGARYDFLGALREGWSNIFPRLFPVREVDRRFFCSALVTYIYTNMGVLPERLNYRTISPKELCQYQLYSRVYQLAGVPKSIPDFNTVEI